ncbi:hypothetical protein GCM10011386_41300 [Parapedobacter defluvii]|uniref:Uncharacterized protein n=1 Tax=Parapedobacter defluvii TaxID=2045106 RepID=A0ABQ1MQ54_9SPHI|nr:hypothetical protein [Parapedobacter defluvii]GGC44759.1 hypothetical protein GCM10011386_41300 [Parapedobacter defluvii]
MNKVIFIASLHRPFNQQLKTTKWVCNFIASNKNNLSSSYLNLGFYYYLINLLYKEYSLAIPEEFNGLPSDAAIFNIYQYLKSKKKEQFIAEIPNIIKSRKTPLEKQIYSTYKAASYYINLAKDKFGLINDKNQLSSDGYYLIGLRSNFYRLSSPEKKFFFRKIIEADFHLFITHCLFAKLERRYDLKRSIEDQIEFINQFLSIRHFNFTSASLENYNIVRGYWAEALGVLDSACNIKKKYLDIITKNENFSKLYDEVTSLFSIFEKENFQIKKKYLKNKKKFLDGYKKCLKTSISDLGFINLYDIKATMRISTANFQLFLDDFYELEKNNLNLFFGNTVNSIDRRERFFIRDRPVIKIKIK